MLCAFFSLHGRDGTAISYHYDLIMTKIIKNYFFNPHFLRLIFCNMTFMTFFVKVSQVL